MSGDDSKETFDAEADAKYHVRLLQSWPPPYTTDNALVSSFYGLQLELRGNAKDHEDLLSPITLFNEGQTVLTTGEMRKPTSTPLHFSNTAPSSALLESLNGITGPFEVAVVGKVPTPALSESMDEDTWSAIQQMASVQVGNTLLEINGERFLLDRATGAEVYRHLWIVATGASLAMPFELTLRRQNLAQASAKIVPFARRKDVQDAQIAQLATLAAQDAALPTEIRCKKLFLVQQLDFERQHYLAAYVSGPLQQLHTRIMGSCQWQAYEFGKSLWYFHAPTTRLCAEHPLRSHPEARELIERVQIQVQHAVQRLQHQTRSRQRRQRLMGVIQAERRQRDEEKRKEQERQAAVRRIQRRLRAFQRRKRLLAMIQAEKRRQEKQRIEDKRQLELVTLERQQLTQQLDDLKLELQQLKLLNETKLSVQSETQTSAHRAEDNAVEMMKRDEHQRLQQGLEKLELDIDHRNVRELVVESETQTSSRSSDTDAAERLKIPEQQHGQQKIAELELNRLQHTKQGVESVTQTSGRRGSNVRDTGVDTGQELEWQRYLTLLRVTIKNKKKKCVPKNRQTQTESIDGEQSLLTSSMLRAPQNAVSFSSSSKFNGEWKGFPSWQRRSNNEDTSNSSSTCSLLTLKSSLSQFDEFDVLSPPTRTFEAFFAPHEQPPPPFVEHPWRQDATVLPLKSSRKLLEGAQPLTLQMHEYKASIQPVCMTGNSPVSSSPALSPTKLPYITRRRKKVAGSPS